MEDVEDEARLLLGQEEPAGLTGLLLALGRQVDVDPSREQAFRVPGGLAMAEEDQIGHATESSGAPAQPSETPPLT